MKRSKTLQGVCIMSGMKSIKNNRQLFIDDSIIEQSENVQIVMNPPHKKVPVIRQDRPWRSKLTGYYGTVIHDNGVYKNVDQLRRRRLWRG